jgi:hypothetical protein
MGLHAPIRQCSYVVAVQRSRLRSANENRQGVDVEAGHAPPKGERLDCGRPATKKRVKYEITRL